MSFNSISGYNPPDPDPARFIHSEPDRPNSFDFHAHLQRQREWSGQTFGPGDRAKGVVDHIRKELTEIEAAPADITEWIDVVILALDGAWRSGASPDEIIAALVAKQAKNETRTWPDWRTASPDQAIEHVRTDMRYPSDRPGWLGEFQPWPCGRCRKEVDDDSKHDCQLDLSKHADCSDQCEYKTGSRAS